MKMVAVARMRRAQQAILCARPFAVKLEEVLEDLSQVVLSQGFGSHPFYRRGEGAAIGLLLISSDKGLCGSFNANLFRRALSYLESHREAPVFAFAVGKKGRDFLRRLRLPNVTVVSEMVGIFPKVGAAHAALLRRAVAEVYEKESLREVKVLLNAFVSAARQEVVLKDLLPIQPPPERRLGRQVIEFLYEPRPEEILRTILPRYLEAQVYRLLLESQASELAARMNAMDAATKNAQELIGDWTLVLNRTRQAIITKEIAELVGGAEALAS